MQQPLKPQVKRLIKTQHFRAKRVFRMATQDAFAPLDGSLNFSLIQDPPTWITIDRKTGVIAGVAPSLSRSRKYLLTLEVENDYGIVTQSFFIKILAADFIEDFSERLQFILSLKNRKRFADLHAIPHGMLEYLYSVLMHCEDRENFIKLLHENAEKKHILVSDEPTYEEFAEVATAYHHDIEQTIRQQISDEHLLHHAELTNNELHNLFRQGSQPLGMISRPIWNYLAAPDRHNWSSVSTVLDAAAEAVFKLRTENLAQYNSEQQKLVTPKSH